MAAAPARFEGRVAWITGGGHGIGAATARRLASEGAKVGVLALHEESAREVAAACAELGVRGVPTWGDAADLAVLEAAHREIVDQFGPIDILINNVATAIGDRLEDSSEAHWDRIHETNFRSYVRCIRLVTAAMRSRRSGVIVNVSSNHAIRGYTGWSAYASAKGAIDALTRQQAAELGPDGIRVVSVTPGATLTELNARRFADAPDADALRALWISHIPLGRMATADEIASGIAFVASDDASFMTGTDLRLDGGDASFGA